MRALFRIHDGLTWGLYVVGAAMIGAIAAIYGYEVGARYLFAAPTTWAYDVGSFALGIGVFLCIPQVTREGGHIAVTIIYQYLPAARALWLARASALVAVAACCVAGWITVQETERQIVQSVYTTTVTAIPAWWITILMPYAFFNAALHFLRTISRLPPVGA